MSEQGKILIISAPSGSGKTTLVKALMAEIKNLAFSISATNRPSRENEKDKVDYYFLSTENFQEKIKNNEFVEWEEVYENRFYGSLKSEVERIRNKGQTVVFDVDVMGGLNIKKLYKDEALSVFIQPPSIDILQKRLEKRGTDSEEDIQKRLDKAAYEMSFSDTFDITITNNDLEKAKQKLISKVKSFLS